MRRWAFLLTAIAVGFLAFGITALAKAGTPNGSSGTAASTYTSGGNGGGTDGGKGGVTNCNYASGGTGGNGSTGGVYEQGGKCYTKTPTATPTPSTITPTPTPTPTTSTATPTPTASTATTVTTPPAPTPTASDPKPVTAGYTELPNTGLAFSPWYLVAFAILLFVIAAPLLYAGYRRGGNDSK